MARANPARAAFCRSIIQPGHSAGSSLQAAEEISRGLLEPVLEPYAPARDSLFICFPRSSRGQPKLRALVECCARHAR
ncbi:MAG: hypothetical protein AB7I59_09705 [Geminicoccaceae bacterium]